MITKNSKVQGHQFDGCNDVHTATGRMSASLSLSCE